MLMHLASSDSSVPHCATLCHARWLWFGKSYCQLDLLIQLIQTHRVLLMTGLNQTLTLEIAGTCSVSMTHMTLVHVMTPTHQQYPIAVAGVQVWISSPHLRVPSPEHSLAMKPGTSVLLRVSSSPTLLISPPHPPPSHLSNLSNLSTDRPREPT